MTKKTKKIILWVVVIWLASCLFFGGLAAFIESTRENQTKEQTQIKSDFSDVDPIDAQNIIGRWKLSSEIAPQINSTIVIYEKNDSCFCKETYESGSSNTKLLRKEGNKYYDTENLFGEYFLVSEGTLHLYDQDGEYGNGKDYSVTTLK